MSQIKEYHLISYTFGADEKLNKEIVFFELSEIEYLNLGKFLPTKRIYQTEKSDYFIMFKESVLAKKILSDMDSVINIDMDKFEEYSFSVPNTAKEFAFFHNEIMNERKVLMENNYTYESDEAVEKIITECILMHHTDMFFYYIYRYIIYIDFEKRGRAVVSLEDVFLIYEKLCAYLLSSAFNIEFPSRITIDDTTRFSIEYKDIIENSKPYGTVISNYLVYRANIFETLARKGCDDNHFIQLCMAEGYRIANKRLQKSLKSGEYFTHELNMLGNNKTLKISPSPLGFLKIEKLKELARSNTLINELDKYLIDVGFVRVENKEYVDQLRTRFIYRKENINGLFYYKRRIQDNEYAPFGEQDRKNPYRAILMQGQINLTWNEMA